MNTAVPHAGGSDLSVDLPTVHQMAARVRRPRRILFAAMGVGLFAELFFDERPLGLSFPLFVVGSVAALLALGGKEAFSRARKNTWLLAPLFFFATMVFWRDSLTPFNVGASAVLFFLLVHLWAADRVEDLALLQYPLAVLRSVAYAMLKPPGLVSSAVDVQGARTVVGPLLKPLLRGAALTLPVLLLFGALLSSADPAFSAALGRLSFDPLMTAWDLGERLLVVAGWSFAAVGLFSHALRRSVGSELVPSLPATPRLGFLEGTMLLVSTNTLFLAFTLVQGAYFLDASELMGIPHLTYSDYARRGFFQLVAVAMLTLLLLLAVQRWLRLSSPRQAAVFKVAATALIGSTMLLLASALHSMHLYEETYGYTRLRVDSHVFMLALGACLFWRAVTLWWRPERFAFGAFLCALSFGVVLNLINPDAFIAKKNLAREHVDALYLAELSADAAPALAEAVPRLSPRDAELVQYALDRHASRTSGLLSTKLPVWRAATLARSEDDHAALREHHDL
ncbi:MAG: DUF4153 domain-containing protein [Myxococcota bacterium]